MVHGLRHILFKVNMTQTKNPFTINFKFFLLFVIIFFVEILIAVYVHDAIIRPFGGDVLVVVLIYAFVRSFLNTNYTYIAIGVLLFSFAVEISQAFHLVKRMGLEKNTIMRIVMGTTFSYYDLFAYFIGFLICLRMK